MKPSERMLARASFLEGRGTTEAFMLRAETMMWIPEVQKLEDKIDKVLKLTEEGNKDGS